MGCEGTDPTLVLGCLCCEVETDVDETGVSYYGSTRLVLLASNGRVIEELNKDTNGM